MKISVLEPTAVPKTTTRHIRRLRNRTIAAFVMASGVGILVLVSYFLGMA